MTTEAIIGKMPIILIFSAPGGAPEFIGLWGKDFPALIHAHKIPITNRQFDDRTLTFLTPGCFGDQYLITGPVAHLLNEVSKPKAYQIEATPDLGFTPSTSLHPMSAKEGK